MIGQTIGTYRIEAQIGEGGMGAVYRGCDLMLEREVAIKALRPELARQPELVARFRSEAVTLARLNHSHIATLYNFLRQGDDFYMVMEFVRGRTLEEVLRQEGAMDVVRAVRLFCQALAGIAHAHALGIIHRDIKPANLMLTADDEVKVMDFGIARVLGTARHTQTGRLIGTLEYMSPEQMRGQETDLRSDIYSLGILLYEMLTGRVPFQGASDYELMRAQVEQEPPPPREFRPDISLPVELALLRAMTKNPAARFQNAHEFRAALISAAPDAALIPETPHSTTSPIKATRLAAGQTPSADDRAVFTPAADRASGFNSDTGTYTFKLPSFLLATKDRIEAGTGPFGWKHYTAAATAILAAVIGISSINGSAQRKTVPAPQPTPVPVLPARTQQTLQRLTIPEAVTLPSFKPEKSGEPEKSLVSTIDPFLQPAATPTPRPARSYKFGRSRAAAVVQESAKASPTPTPRPSPTPQRGKWDKAMDTVGKTADTAGKVMGLLRRKKTKN